MCVRKRRGHTSPSSFLLGSASPAGAPSPAEGEAGSLFLAGMPGPAADLGLGAVLAAAQIKLAAALPAELRDRAGRIRERFHPDAPGWYR